MTKVKYITKAVNANVNACTITDAAITDNCSIHIVTSPSTVPILNAYQDGNNVVVKFQPQAEPFNIRAEVSIINEFKVDINGDDDDAMPATAEVGGDFNFNYNVYEGLDEDWEPVWNEVNTNVTTAISNIYANADNLYLPSWEGSVSEALTDLGMSYINISTKVMNAYNQANNAYDWANNSYNKANDAFNIGYATIQVASDAYNQANAAFQYGNNRKNEVGAAVTAKGGTWSSTYDWNNTVNSIATIPSGGGSNPRYRVYEYTAEISEIGNYYFQFPETPEWPGWTSFGRGGSIRWLGSQNQRYTTYASAAPGSSTSWNFWSNVSGFWNICINMVDGNGVYINIVNMNTSKTNYDFIYRFVGSDLAW